MVPNVFQSKNVVVSKVSNLVIKYKHSNYLGNYIVMGYIHVNIIICYSFITHGQYIISVYNNILKFKTNLNIIINSQSRNVLSVNSRVCIYSQYLIGLVHHKEYKNNIMHYAII